MTQEERYTNGQQWEVQIQSFQDSGLTQQQWCEKEGIKLSALRYWLRKFREEKSREAAPDWLKVCVSDEDPMPVLALPQAPTPMDAIIPQIRLHIHDMVWEIPTGTPPAYLSALPLPPLFRISSLRNISKGSLFIGRNKRFGFRGFAYHARVWQTGSLSQPMNI